MSSIDFEQIQENLYLIPLPQKIPGFNPFICSYLITKGPTFVVDVGPAASIDLLCAAIKQIGVTHLDFILTTHIHIDHAGGLARFLSYFPETPIICHKAGVKHLANPEKLWQGSLKTLKSTAKAYGPIEKVPAHLLQDAQYFESTQIQVIPTPGHAIHHLSFLFENLLFAGEAAGVYTPIDDTHFLLRPATPPRFFLNVYQNSLDLLLDLSFENILFGHMGSATNGKNLLAKHKKQLGLWEAVVKQTMDDTDQQDFFSVCLHRLRENDPLLEHWDKLPAGIKLREKNFIQNSIRGFSGYIEETGKQGT